MNRPHFLCLMPVWNHRHETIQNALRCFLDQTYKNATLAIIDDRPRKAQISMTLSDWGNWESVGVYYLHKHTDPKFPSIAAKYNYALKGMGMFLDFTHVAIWDDDDGFTENHLEHAAWHYGTGALWTYPDKVFTTFGGSLNVEPTEGRFWSSITFDRKCLDPWGGLFPDRKNVGQDQMFLGELKTRFGRMGERATPTLPTYVYRWGAEGEQHWSGLSRGFDCESSWDACPHSVSGKPLEAVYDEFYVETRREIEAYYNQNLPRTTPPPAWCRLGSD